MLDNEEEKFAIHPSGYVMLQEIVVFGSGSMKHFLISHTKTTKEEEEDRGSIPYHSVPLWTKKTLYLFLEEKNTITHPLFCTIVP